MDDVTYLSERSLSAGLSSSRARAGELASSGPVKSNSGEIATAVRQEFIPTHLKKLWNDLNVCDRYVE